MGQHLARKEVEEGLRLYNQQHYEGAIRKWKRALHKIKHRGDRFTTLGYLATVHCDCGKYRDMLAYGIMQIDIANEAENSNMRAEAYLCLARSNERLCDYHKAVSYSRHCLQNQPRDNRVHGYVFLCQANAYVGFGFFTKALENLEQAMRISKECEDPALELQVFITMGQIFVMLKDYEKGLGFHLKATEISKSFKVCDIGTKYQRIAYYNLAVALLELGRCDEAYSCCQNALPMATAEGDKPTQAKCIRVLANVERKQDQYQKSLEFYEEALVILTDVGDRAGQIEVLLGRAETMHYSDMHSMALSSIDKALDIAQAISNKVLIYACHRLKEDIYNCLGDGAVSKEHQNMCYSMLEEMNLFCALCSNPFGERPSTLEPLNCFHIVHAKCITNSNSLEYSQALVDSVSKECNKCRRIDHKGSVTPSRLSPMLSRANDNSSFPANKRHSGRLSPASSYCQARIEAPSTKLNVAAARSNSDCPVADSS